MTSSSTRGATRERLEARLEEQLKARLEERLGARLEETDSRHYPRSEAQLGEPTQVSTRGARLDSGSRLKSQLEGLGSTQGDWLDFKEYDSTRGAMLDLRTMTRLEERSSTRGVKSLGEGLKICRSSGPPALSSAL